MHPLKQALFATALAGIAFAVASQPAPQRAAPAASRAPATDIGPSNVVQAATEVAQLIDGGRIAEVWDGSSPVSQRAITRDKFVAEVNAQRKPLGAPTSRHWIAVTRNAVQGDKTVPSGMYVSARFETHFAGNRIAEELFSFRYDEDSTWRLSGYWIK
ncbi:MULTISPECIES: DUF4019 domain-containing protein [unclassified Lysobacter]|uniref:DUF4019 domain-containing protein n=1 Tax=unclassified Lysobacter TaxID=2635362 RepID=UPI001C21DE4B|nr:DUF4019 domain-containing protein [Lysobacter sp. MMG2]MBU8976805.1 DUF4019 domain-containing protein [Lysobacter sp. MMG2]